MDEQLALAAGARVMRLLALARGLEDDGQYNVAKLVRAAAFSEGVRTTWERPRLDGTLLDELGAAVDELRVVGGRAPVDALATALDALRRGEMPTLETVPTPWACRYCGQVVLGDPPAACPACRARRLTFQPFAPIFYLDPLAPEELLPALEASLAEIQGILDGVTEAHANAGVWPVRAILAHLLGSEQLLARRACRMLDEDEPVFLSVAPSDIGTGADTPPTLADMLEDLAQLRAATLARLATLDAAQWQCRGYHPEWGWMTVQQQVSYLARHEQSHLAELEATARGQVWRPAD